MNFQQSVQTCFRKFVDFSGRGSRSEYWWFFLCMLIVVFVANLVHPSLAGLLSLVFFLPQLSAAVRRLHDSGRSGWWVLIGLVPVVGLLIGLYLLVQPSDPAPNEYGEPPVSAPPVVAPL